MRRISGRSWRGSHDAVLLRRVHVLQGEAHQGHGPGGGRGAPEAIYVGDEVRDAEAAREARVDFGAVGWGQHSPEALRAAGAVESSPAWTRCGGSWP